MRHDRPVLLPELIPDLASTVRVHTGRKSNFARELGAGEKFGLAFIDADHRHPWPLLDVLRLAPYIQNPGWIVLHDIQLGTYGKEVGEPGPSLGASHPTERNGFSSGGHFGKSDPRTLAPVSFQLAKPS